MDFRESLICHRKRMGWSQEELGFKINVSRQTISKWESGDTTPEMEKLIKMAALFNISTDALIGIEKPTESRPHQRYEQHYEYKSKLTFAGIPFIHINTGRGFRRAKGIIAIGNAATGVVAVGALSVGVISIGAVSIGLASFAAVALGFVACGALSIGALAAGGIARGIYAIGGVAIARDIAIGGFASGYIAAGESVKGIIQFSSDSYDQISLSAFRSTIIETFPDINRRILDLLTAFLGQ